jgi:hypothetical protein
MMGSEVFLYLKVSDMESIQKLEKVSVQGLN